MKQLFLILLIIFSFILLSAKPVSEKDALNVIKVLIKNHPKLAKKVLSPTKLISIKQDNHVLAFAKDFSNNGFIVISADTDVNTLITYSENSKLDLTENENNIFLYFLRQDIIKRLELLPNLEKVREKNNSLWNQYINATDQFGVISLNNVRELNLRTEVNPLLGGIVWSQSDINDVPVWNYYTPDNMVCGCVATAMAQVMKYYSWPPIGVGSHTYTDTYGSGETLTANFGETTYPWDLTLDEYSASSSEQSRQSAGLVTSHCGISVNMKYGYSASSASTSKVANALKNHFRYNAEYFWWENDDDGGTGSIFLNKVQDNILNGMPIQMAIRNSSDQGHAVVVDGFRDTSEENEYHVNFGWGGSNNGFYTFPVFAGWDQIHGAVMNTVTIPYVENGTVYSSSGNFSLNWENSDQSNADSYQISEQVISENIVTVNDGAEEGEDNWIIDSENWDISTYYNYTGNSSFRGFISSSSGEGTLELESDYYVPDANSQISYYWKQNYIADDEYKLQVTTDNLTWETLATHTNGDTEWAQQTASLSSYVGDKISVRFYASISNGSFYDGSAYSMVGFFMDDFEISNVQAVSEEDILPEVTSTSVSYSGKTDGTYFYNIRPEFSNQWWEWDNDSPRATVKAVVGDFALETPQNVIINESSDNRMLIIWDAVQNATSYNVYASDDPNADFVEWELVADNITTTQEYFVITDEKKFFHVKAVM